MHAKRSIRANQVHLSSYRALALAQSLAGRVDDARETLRYVENLDPSFTLARFAANYPSRDRVPHYLDKLVRALRDAGAREH